MTSRRGLLIASACGVALAPWCPALAADSRVRRVGLLSPVLPLSDERWQSFLRGMRELGYVDGRNVAFVWRSAEGRNERLPALLEELAKADVEVIVTHTTPAAVAARKAPSHIPVVAAAFADPVASGIVASLSRPGGHITGISLVNDEIGVKLVEFARAIAPKLARAAVLGDSGPHQRQMKNMEAALGKVGVKTLPVWISSPEQVDAAFETMTRERAEALFVLLSPLLVSRREQIAKLALRARLPTYTESFEFPESGALLGYGSHLPSHFHRAATFVDKILKGAKPADLPVEQPTRFQTIVNLRTAKALGVTVPGSILVSADKVIE